MDVSVIMINYNTYALTRDALESIFTYTQNLEYEIILIDNQSPDGSGEKLKEAFQGKIKYIQAGGNLGTSKSFNTGVRNAAGKYILWLNTDILIKDNFICQLFRYMEENPQCGICGGNVLDFNGNPSHSHDRYDFTLQTVKKQLSIFHCLYRNLLRKQLSLHYNYTDQPMPVKGIIGADMMIRRELFDLVGFFDEDIFMYCEETEFAYRVSHNTNYTIMSIPFAHLYHLDGASFSAKKDEFNEWRYRTQLNGNLVYFQKHFGRNIALRYLKIYRRSYLKFMILCSVFLRKKYRLYKSRRKVLTEILRQYQK